MRMAALDPRDHRRDPDGETAGVADLAGSPSRANRDRIAVSPFLARLGGVTQVVSAGGSGLLHNRLTHSIKVAQVARAIAERISTSADADLAQKLGGLDPDVVEAASLTHDLGHPPFGHLGERILDRIARNRFGLADGFEGNAQTFRIITTTDVRGQSAAGLDLTAAVRAAVLKYPWARLHVPVPHPSTMEVPPRGAAEQDDAPGTGSSKFSAYVTELDDFAQARAVRRGARGVGRTSQRTVPVRRCDGVRTEPPPRVLARAAAPPSAREGLVDRRRRRVRRIGGACPRSIGGRPARQCFRRFAGGRTSDGRVFRAVDLQARRRRFADRFAAAPVGARHVEHRAMARGSGAEFVHRRFVLLRPDLALHQRGQAALVSTLVDALEAWLGDRDEVYRLPRRLHDLVELAHGEYRELARTAPELLVGATGDRVDGVDAVRWLARGRAVVNFVASLTDKQAVTLLDALSGRASQPWSDSFVL